MKTGLRSVKRPLLFDYAKAAAKVVFLNRRVPLFVSWILTNRCNYSCVYCHSRGNISEELTTQQALDFAGRLASLGTRSVTFTGGEPLMREDLGKIVDCCSAQNIAVILNSNGSLIEERIEDVRNITMATLSLDGPQKVHDAVRGKGSFGTVMRAVDCLRAKRIKVCIGTTLSSVNLSSLDEIFRISKTGKLPVFFQPAEKYQLRNNELDPISPSVKEYKHAIEAIIAEKRHNIYIGNSLSGLKHLSYWPDPHPPLKCFGGKLFVRIDFNGDVKICGRHCGSVVYGNVLHRDFLNIFRDVATVVCVNCWCAPRVEFNKAMAFDLGSVSNVLRKF